MKLPPFTLVYRPGEASRVRRSRKSEARPAGMRLLGAGVTSGLDSLKPAVRRALLSSAALFDDPHGWVSFVTPAVLDLVRQSRVETVGFWDISSQVGELPRVIKALNEAQPVFTFFDVQANVHSGLIGRPERLVEWARRNRLDARTIESISGNQILFDDFVSHARPIREALGLNHLIGIVPAMVAFEEDGVAHWNYFSMSEPGLVLASTFDVARLAARAKQPFEVAVVDIALSTLLSAINPDVDFHEETRGCLFDFNRDRETIVDSLRKLEIEPGCLDKMMPKYRDAAGAMMTALREARWVSNAQGEYA